MRNLLLKTTICIFFIQMMGCAQGPSLQRGFFFGHDLRQDNRIIYVLDLSGSMNAHSGNQIARKGIDAAAKISGSFTQGLLGRSAGSAVRNRVSKLKKRVEKVKLHLIASLNGLPPSAKFNVVLFDGQVQRMSPVYVKATSLNTAIVSAFVDRLTASGSTNILEAMDTALRDKPTRVILLTDGMPTSSTPQQVISMVRGHKRNKRFVVSTVGVGDNMGQSFLTSLARENGGSYIFYP